MPPRKSSNDNWKDVESGITKLSKMILRGFVEEFYFGRLASHEFIIDSIETQLAKIAHELTVTLENEKSFFSVMENAQFKHNILAENSRLGEVVIGLNVRISRVVSHKTIKARITPCVKEVVFY